MKTVPSTKIFKRLTQGGLWATAGKILFIFSTLAWNVLLTRILNEKEVGAFYLIASVVIFGELVVLGGMNQAVMRLIAGKSDSRGSVRAIIKGTAILVLLFAGSGGMLYFLIIGPKLGQTIFQSSLIGELAGFTALWFALRAFQSYLAFVLRGFQRIGIAAFIDGAFTAIFITFALGYLWLHSNHADIREVLTIVIGALVSTVTLAIFLVQHNYRQTSCEPGLLLREPIRIGIPLSILAMAGVGINEAHIWIVGIFTNQVDVAIYGAASRLAKFVQMPLLIINGVIAPTIAQLFEMKNNVQVEEVLRKTAAIVALPTILMAIIVFLFSKDLLGLVFGSAYSAGWSVLVILVLGHTISVAVGSAGVLMAMTGHQSKLMVIAIFSGLLGIGVSISLVNVYGVFGVSIGAATGKGLQNIGMWLYCLKGMRIKSHGDFYALKFNRNARVKPEFICQ